MKVLVLNTLFTTLNRGKIMILQNPAAARLFEAYGANYLPYIQNNIYLYSRLNSLPSSIDK